MRATTPDLPGDRMARRAIAANLHRTRLALGMSRQNLADEMRINDSPIRKIELFINRDPLVATLQRQARAMDRALRLRIVGIPADPLPEYPNLPAAEADRRHVEDLIAQFRTLRRLAGLTQAEVGARMGVTNATVSLVEAAKRPAVVSTFQRYARAIDGRLAFALVEALAPDPVAIERAMAGQASFAKLADADKVALMREHGDRHSILELSRRLGVAERTVSRWRERVAA